MAQAKADIKISSKSVSLPYDRQLLEIADQIAKLIYHKSYFEYRGESEEIQSEDLKSKKIWIDWPFYVMKKLADERCQPKCITLYRHITTMITHAQRQQIDIKIIENVDSRSLRELSIETMFEKWDKYLPN